MKKLLTLDPSTVESAPVSTIRNSETWLVSLEVAHD